MSVTNAIGGSIFDSENCEGAERLVIAEFRRFATKVHQRNNDYFNDFFDGRNRDDWMDGFIQHLQERFQQKDRIASND